MFAFFRRFRRNLTHADELARLDEQRSWDAWLKQERIILHTRRRIPVWCVERAGWKAEVNLN